MPLPEIIFLVFTALILIGYHTHLYMQFRKTPEETAVGMADRMRRQWVQTIMKERRDILAVQTVRNWVMASSFLASSAILISLGALHVTVRPADFAEISHALNLVGTPNETLWLIKLMTLVVVFFFAFFNFTLAIRYFNSAGFGLGLPDAPDGPASHECVTEVINHASLHYAMGMRCYYLAIPFALWIFGPTWMLTGTIFLVLVLYRLDRTV